MLFGKKKKKSVLKENVSFTSNQIGGLLSKNVQNGTSETINGMSLLAKELERTANVDIAQKKGNLFEYIEAAKFNRNAANKGIKNRAVVTAADGRPHAAADIEIVDQNKRVIREVQAKFCDTHNSEGVDTSAASTITKQRNAKYHGMQRLGRKEDDFYTDPQTGKTMSFLEREKQLANTRADSNGVYAEDYRDVSQNLTDELTDESTGITSGGTTLEEINRVNDNSEKYLQQMKFEQYKTEISSTAVNVAAANMISTGIISGVSNVAACFKSEKDVETAVKDLAKDVGTSGAKGAVVGALGAGIRIAGENAGNTVAKTLLSESSGAMVVAGGIVDCGVSVYEYAKGEIDAAQFVENLKDTTIKSGITVYFSMAAKAVFGATSPFIPIVVYSTANYVIKTTKEIVANAELNAQEYNRLAALNNEMIKVIQEYRKTLIEQMSQYQESYRASMGRLLEEFDAQICTSNDIDGAVYAIVEYANQTGMALQHTDFNDFMSAMQSEDAFVLK